MQGNHRLAAARRALDDQDSTRRQALEPVVARLGGGPDREGGPGRRRSITSVAGSVTRP